MGVIGEGEVRLASTGYPGHADEILKLRNANRETPQTSAYLDWRYSHLPGAPEPRIFWLRQPEGRAVGMAAAIFRPYWVQGRMRQAAVVGDISLDASLRGRGLGRKLLEYMTHELRQTNPEGFSCVIPNEAANAALSGLGWKTVDDLVANVLLLRPEKKLRRLLRLPGASRAAANVVQGFASWWIGRHRRPGFSLQTLAAPDSALAQFWNDLDKSKMVLGERSVAALGWRYTRHPGHAFRLSVLVRDGQTRGYVVHGFTDRDDECSVHDFLLKDRADLGCLLALLVEKVRQDKRVEAIRLVMNRANPCLRGLWKLGFVPREATAQFLIDADNNKIPPDAGFWHLTLGDKDI